MLIIKKNPIFIQKMRQIDWKDDPNTQPPRCVRVARYIIWLAGTSMY